MFGTLYPDFQSIESPLIPNTVLCAKPEKRQYGPLNMNLFIRWPNVAHKGAPVSTWGGIRGFIKP